MRCPASTILRRQGQLCEQCDRALMMELVSVSVHVHLQNVVQAQLPVARRQFFASGKLWNATEVVRCS